MSCHSDMKVKCPRVHFFPQNCSQTLQKSLNKYTTQLLHPSIKKLNYREDATMFHAEFKITGKNQLNSGDSFGMYC